MAVATAVALTLVGLSVAGADPTRGSGGASDPSLAPGASPPLLPPSLLGLPRLPPRHLGRPPPEACLVALERCADEPCLQLAADGRHHHAVVPVRPALGCERRPDTGPLLIPVGR